MDNWPEAHDAEKHLLSAVMRGGKNVRTEALNTVTPDDFTRYRDLARVILSIAQDGRPDKETVDAEYDGDRLEEVIDSRAVPRNALRWIEQIKQAKGSRQVIEASSKASRKAAEEPFEEVANDLENRLVEIAKEGGTDRPEPIGDLIGGVVSKIEDQQGQDVTGIPSGFPSIDNRTKGWQDGDLIIPAASPSMGKTAFALACAHNAAKKGHSVCVFSLEMMKGPLIRRFIQKDARVSLRQTTIPDGDMRKVRRAQKRFQELPLYVDDTTGLTPVMLQTKVRQLRAHADVDMVVVDYLQEMRSPDARDSRQGEMHDIASQLKGVAKTLDIPVMVPSQTSRGPDRDKRPPSLSDLRQAGEEPADVVLGLYRPEYYGKSVDNSGKPAEGIGKVSILKQRNGPTGTVELAFVEEHAAWEAKARHETNGSPF